MCSSDLDPVRRGPRILGKADGIFLQLNAGQLLIPEIRDDDGELPFDQVFQDGLVLVRSKDELLSSRVDRVDDGVAFAPLIEEHVELHPIVRGGGMPIAGEGKGRYLTETEFQAAARVLSTKSN